MPTVPSDTIDSRSSNAIPLPLAEIALVSALVPIDEFIANSVLIPFIVAAQAAALPMAVLDRRIYSCERDAQGYPVRIVSEVNGSKYDCKESAIEVALSDNAKIAYGTQDAAEAAKARQGLLSLLLAREVAVATMMQDTGVITQTAAAAAVWSHATDGNPLKDVQTGMGVIARATGVSRSRLEVVVPGLAYEAMCYHPRVREVYTALTNNKGVIPTLLPTETIAGLLGCAKVHITDAQKDTSNRAKASSLTEIWNKTKVTIFAPSAPGYEEIGVGNNLIWPGGLDVSELSSAVDLPVDPSLAAKVDKYRDERATGDVIRTRKYEDPKILNAKAAYIVSGVLA